VTDFVEIGDPEVTKNGAPLMPPPKDFGSGECPWTAKGRFLVEVVLSTFVPVLALAAPSVSDFVLSVAVVLSAVLLHTADVACGMFLAVVPRAASAEFLLVALEDAAATAVAASFAHTPTAVAATFAFGGHTLVFASALAVSALATVVAAAIVAVGVAAAAAAVVAEAIAAVAAAAAAAAFVVAAVAGVFAATARGRFALACSEYPQRMQPELQAFAGQAG